MAPNRRNRCFCAMKPTPAPIRRRAPTPSRYCATGSSVRNDTWPNRTAPPKSRSSQHRYKPTGRSCTDASSATTPLRAAARRNRNRRFRATRRRARALCRMCCMTPWGAVRQCASCVVQCVSNERRAQEVWWPRRRFPSPRALFRAHSAPSPVARVVPFPELDARHRAAAGLRGRSRLCVPLQSVLSDTNKRSARQRRLREQKLFSC